ncbi:MAG: primosomal protein N' [Bdellovibrionota bacterium]
MSSNLVNVVIPPLSQSFTYNIPKTLDSSISVGHMVEVPFGRRVATGYVIEQVGTEKTLEFKVKSVRATEENLACFNHEQLEFFKWVSNYYVEPLSNVIEAAIPKPAPKKYNRWVRLIAEPEKKLRGKLQIAILEMLKAHPAPLHYSKILREHKGAGVAIKKLAEKEIIAIDAEEVLDHHISDETAPDWAKQEIELDQAQTDATQKIIEASSNNEFKVFTLYGVTGSGKTEVYIEAIKKIIADGKGVLIIVPEIALTPQLVDRFKARLGDQIAVLHSGLSTRTRWDSWRALLEKRNYIAIGARSAIFAPVPNLGLIIVDEEHDSSYKQADGLRYNARDLAIVRGKFCNAPVVLGSATPSLETYHNTKIGKYEFLQLAARHVSASEISFELIDLNRVKPWEMPSKNISPKLFKELEDVLAKNEQAFILYNRRGFASYMQCDTCEEVVECPNCSVTMTYHRYDNSLTCHYCAWSMLPPELCPACTGITEKENKSASATPGKLVQRGGGTQKVFEELEELFPSAKIDRLDRDTATNIQSYRDILDRMRSKETSILVGTQMIAKGHDLPGVTLVGVVDCDVGLHMPDFRSGEKVFQLLTQTSGRAGRGEIPGKVVLQTRVPNHLSLNKTIEKDYSGFAKQELIQREALRYPPYSRLLRIVAGSQDKTLPEYILKFYREQAENFIKKENLNVQLLGPVEAPLHKLKSLYRWHILCKSPRSKDLNQIVRYLKGAKISDKLKISFDIDPQEML